MITVSIVADSICRGHRLTSFILEYPRFIHSELMTHRMLSRNAASSRAIPVERMIDRILKQPAEPVRWGANQKGMQAAKDLEPEVAEACREDWMAGLAAVLPHVRRMLDRGVHKQIANRLLEPWAHMQTLVSATEYANFFNLRCHPDAQPEFQALAYAMLRAYNRSTPAELAPGDWHLPFMRAGEFTELDVHARLKIAAARAARTSYYNFDGTIDPAKDAEVHDKLTTSGHWSPMEHPAQAMDDERYEHTPWCGNFKGWVQYRKLFPGESRNVLRPELANYKGE